MKTAWRTVPAMNARDIALRRLVTLAKRYPDLHSGGGGSSTSGGGDYQSTQSEAHAHGLSPRDAALAVAIEQAVVRNWNALVVIISAHLARPWIEVEHGLQAALLAGTSQLLLMDKIPDHAAINETVEWAKKNIRFKAGGFVNAVLHRILEIRQDIVPQFDPSSRNELPLPDGRAVRFTKDIFSDDAVTRLAEQTSHPWTLIQSWHKRLGRDRSQQLALHSLVQPPIIITGVPPAPGTINTNLTPHDSPGSFVFAGSHVDLLELLKQNPTARVQDPVTAHPVQATSTLDPPPKIIIDYCAGRGTKSRQLADLYPQANVIATDINPDRRAELVAQFSHHPTIKVAQPDQLLDLAGSADLLVLDVPCSNTGVLARRVEAKHRLSPDHLRKLTELQRQIIADALFLLAPTGRVLYCTCSIEPMENEEVVTWANKWHRFDVLLTRTTLPEGLPGDSPTHYHDGGFFSLWRR